MNISKNKTSLSKGIFRLSFLLIAFFTVNCIFAQFTIPKKPSFQTSVYDYANILSASEKSQLEEKLIRYSDSSTTQIVVVTIESLNGEDIGILTPKWGQEWGIGGTAKNDNGVLILLAKKEKRIWISPGYGLEDRLTAGIGGEITRNIIIPEFKAGSYYEGLNKGTDAIIDVFKGKYKGERKQQSKGKEFPIFPFIAIVVIVLILISRNKGGRGGNNGNNSGGGPSLLDAIILSNLGRSSGGGFGGFGGGSSGGGGGFGGGFGGGGFSGGGSGGSW
ncbi:TPM domain-containing protein [Flavobacterium reichenbachii]|uniref:Methanol dehydrogenase n=1 Tax=Flavobacterium reichenbachii TaxID=362418 RepID=A0A085ZQ42_9FLAO|nr:TPM domain-containing protein [Flavobacterium reichenbachii]KFF06556.1 methanol dehydrogenase [Flavobacterium reichenbachii]OXB18839.1 methanol dehydrogenase [Flavobacterium reichenbachii]